MEPDWSFSIPPRGVAELAQVYGVVERAQVCGVLALLARDFRPDPEESDDCGLNREESFFDEEEKTRKLE